MTRGTKSNDYNVVNVNLMGMKIGSDRSEYAFKVFTGWGDNENVIEEKAGFIKGKFDRIELGGYDYTDEKGTQKHSKTITFFFNDGENTIKYGTGYNMVSRQIIYCLASIEGKIGEITLSPYISKKGNKNMRVENDGEPVRMKFDFEKDIKSKCKYSEEFQKTSYVELDKWIDEVLVPEINEKMRKQEEDSYDDLPF